ncbi:MAG TPA: protein TolR [Gammaproteobacteria bacterium]|nr:protein TolR [Gammaproteobacteria bacterium]
MNTIKSAQRRKPIIEINVVPYIDIMLVLLIIFMVTTPLLTQGVKIHLPHASTQTLPADKSHPIIVTVDVQGNEYLNISANPNKPIDPITLHNIVSAELRSEAQQNQKPIVLVKGDNNASYGNVVQAMVLLQQAGASNVGLVTQPSPQQPQR